jgi:phenylpropionate dioxygenase-like ring-hydroxylating dioxygenase large terminal subunit
MSRVASKHDVVNIEQAARVSAPPADRFPAFPASWYYVCRSRQLRQRPVSVEIAGRRLAVFRGSGGRPAVIDADCAHMGADLSRGRVVSGRLQCPFHGWQYAAEGHCTHIPAQQEIPVFARQKAYAVAEQYGLLFVFLEGEPLFPLPELFEPTGAPLVASSCARYMMDCPWYMFGANGFDLQHFALVHDRELVGEVHLDSPAPFARRIRFTSRVAGTSLRDQFIRTLAGSEVEVAITSWGGNLIAVSARFRRAVSRVLFSTSPDEANRTWSNLFVLVERGDWWVRWAQPLSLWIRRTLTLAFLRGDIHDVRRARYRPGTLIEADQAMVDYYRWLANLPQSREEHT